MRLITTSLNLPEGLQLKHLAELFPPHAPRCSSRARSCVKSWRKSPSDRRVPDASSPPFSAI